MKSALNPQMNMLGFPWTDGDPMRPRGGGRNGRVGAAEVAEQPKKKRGGDVEQKYWFMMVRTLW